MILDYLEIEIAELEVRVSQDLANHFGEADIEAIVDAYGRGDKKYLNTDGKERCAASLVSFIAVKRALNSRDIEGTLHAMKHVTHFWSLLFSSELEQQRLVDKSSKGGGNKLGYEGPIKQYVRRACEQLCLDELPVKQAAARIAKLFEDNEELEIYRPGEICPIEVLGYNRDTGTLSYLDRQALDKQKSPVDDKRLQKLIREIREPKKSE